jgi:hypothetical protein
MADKELAKVVRAGFDKLCAEFTPRVVPLGFVRTRKAFWTREHPLHVDVVHLHRGGVSYGAPINASVDVRIHLAIRVLNDDFEALALNGPSTSSFLGARPGYHLSFNARSLSQFERCLTDSVRFVEEQGLPWLSMFSAADALLDRADSPLLPATRERLRAAIANGGDPARTAASRKLLGIRS